MSRAKYIGQLGSETVVYGLAMTLNKIITPLLIPIYTRVLTPDEYGVIATMTSFLSVCLVAVVLGMDAASGRWYYDSNEPAYQRGVICSWFWFQTGMSLVVALLLWSLASPISQALLFTPTYSWVVRASSVLIMLSTFSKVTGNMLRLQRRPWMAVIYNTGLALMTLAITILLVVVLDKGLVGFYQAQLAVAILASVGAIVILGAWIAPKRVSWNLTREMLGFGLPLVPAGLFTWVIASSDRIILGNLVGMSEVGIYAISSSIAALLGLLTGAFQMAYGPFSMSLVLDPNADWVYSKVLTAYALLGCIVGTAVSLCAPLLVSIFATPQYYAAESSVPFIVFATLVNGAYYIAVTGSSIAKKSLSISIGLIGGAVINVGLNFILIPRFGRDGAAISLLVASLVSTGFVFAVSQKNYHISYRFRDALAPLFLSGALILVNNILLPESGLWTWAIRGMMCLAFVPLAFWLKVIRGEHMLRLFKQIFGGYGFR